MRRVSLALVCGLAGAARIFAACTETPLQGDEYRPDGALPLGSATAREAGACDGAACDGGVAPPESRDASVEPANACDTARAFGTLAGDVNGPSATTTGTCSEFVGVRVQEQDDSASGVPMRVRVSLTATGPSADGAFDLYVFFDPLRDLLACASPQRSSLAKDGVVTPIALTWGEGTLANGGDDARTIIFKIVRAGGPCTTGSGWSLTVEGNR